MKVEFIQGPYTTSDIKHFAQHFYKNCYLGSVDLQSWRDFCAALSKRQIYEAVEGICEHYKTPSSSFVLNLLEIITSPNNN